MKPNRRIHLCVLIDALGWQVIEGQNFLTDVLPYRRPLRTVLGFSSGAIPTILTGQLPMKTGHWNLFYYDPEGSPFRWFRHFAFLPARVLEHRITRKLLKEMGRRVLGLGSLFECAVSPRVLPLFNWVEKRNIYSKGGVGNTPSIFDQLSESGIEHRIYTYHHWKDTEIFERAKQDIANTDATFFFVYLSELDHTFHEHCQEKDLVKRKLDWYAGKLRELLAAARRIDPQATMAIFSDHGMTPVSQHHDVVAEIEGLGLTIREDYLAVYDSTMARFWFFSDAARNRIPSKLEALSCGRTLTDAELKQLGIFFPDRRFGEVIFLLHPGWLMTRSNFNGRQWKPVGMHGYHPDDAHSDAVFLSSENPVNEMQTIADVYPYMLETAQGAR